MIPATVTYRAVTSIRTDFRPKLVTEVPGHSRSGARGGGSMKDECRQARGEGRRKDGKARKMKAKAYEKELRRLQAELCHLQEWVKATGQRIVVVLRGARRRREGRDDQGDHGAGEPPRLPGRGAPRALGPREEPDVHAALPAALPGRRRDRDLRPELVQPGRRRARAGLLHEGAAPPVPGGLPPVREAGRRERHPAAQVLAGGEHPTSRSGGSRPGSTTPCGSGSSAPPTSSRAGAGTTTRAPGT